MKKKGENEGRATAAYYEARRGDLSGWSEQPTKATVAPSGSVVFSLRLSPSELDEIREAAASRHTTVSGFIRSNILNALHRTGAWADGL